MRYPHHLLCKRTGAGAQDPDTGAHTPGAATVVYDGEADVQDKGEVVRRDASGRPEATSEATAYLEDESEIGAFRHGDVVTVTWEDGSTADAEVQRVVRLDGKLHLRWL